jgi:hypothetical protein
VGAYRGGEGCASPGARRIGDEREDEKDAFKNSVICRLFEDYDGCVHKNVTPISPDSFEEN